MNVQVHCYTGCVVLLYSVTNEGICHNECTGTLLHWMCCFVVQCCQGICHNEYTGTLLHWMCCFVVQCCQRGYLSQWMYRYIVTLDVLFCCTLLPTRVSVTMNVQVHCYTGCVVLLYRVSASMNVQVHCYTGCLVLLSCRCEFNCIACCYYSWQMLSDFIFILNIFYS